MKALKIDPKSGVSIFEVSDSQLVGNLGENYRSELSEDGSIEYLCHELWKVAELEVNNFATMETKVVIGGLVIARPSPGSDFPEGFTSSENIDLIESTNKDSALGIRISEYYRKNLTQRKFELSNSNLELTKLSFSMLSHQQLSKGTGVFLLMYKNQSLDDFIRLRLAVLLAKAKMQCWHWRRFRRHVRIRVADQVMNDSW